MIGTNRLHAPLEFSQTLYERMMPLNPGIRKMALYEFRYALENLFPPGGWGSIMLDKQEEIEAMVSRRDFYEAIQLKPLEKDRIVLDESITRLTRMLFAGLVRGVYPDTWVNKLFYFDIRGFFFLPRTEYFTEAALAHFGGKPFLRFEPRQTCFDMAQDIGYLDFEAANAEIDQAFIQGIQKLIAAQGTPMIITLAGPTASGKTEITERLLLTFKGGGRKVTSIEMDNFLLDRDYRGTKAMGKETIHFNLFKHSLQHILGGKKIFIPCYDVIYATSSHDLQGNLKPGCKPIEVDPADVIFLEGNFPFHMQEITGLISLKIVYLTDDPVRLKRKWKREIDYRKNHDPAAFCNRFFKTQFIRAVDIYRPLMETCDMVVDTTGATLWAVAETAAILRR
jgi:uridine kinase